MRPQCKSASLVVLSQLDLFVSSSLYLYICSSRSYLLFVSTLSLSLSPTYIHLKSWARLRSCHDVPKRKAASNQVQLCCGSGRWHFGLPNGSKHYPWYCFGLRRQNPYKISCVLLVLKSRRATYAFAPDNSQGDMRALQAPWRNSDNKHVHTNWCI